MHLSAVQRVHKCASTENALGTSNLFALSPTAPAFNAAEVEEEEGIKSNSSMALSSPAQIPCYFPEIIFQRLFILGHTSFSNTVRA
jgi:hypothetical protein